MTCYGLISHPTALCFSELKSMNRTRMERKKRRTKNEGGKWKFKKRREITVNFVKAVKEETLVNKMKYI